MKRLDAATKHWAIPLSEQPLADMDNAQRIDSHQVSVVGTVVNRAQREAIDHCSNPLRVDVAHDVAGLEQVAFPK